MVILLFTLVSHPFWTKKPVQYLTFTQRPIPAQIAGKLGCNAGLENAKRTRQVMIPCQPETCQAKSGPVPGMTIDCLIYVNNAGPQSQLGQLSNNRPEPGKAKGNTIRAGLFRQYL